MDEDCLFLSVTAPARTTDRQPVHVFTQGGGFSFNSNSNYNASDVVTDAEIVSVQFVSCTSSSLTNRYMFCADLKNRTTESA